MNNTVQAYTLLNRHQTQDVRKIYNAKIIACSSASGGVGLSTLIGLLAIIHEESKQQCVLVDLDIQSGGLDVLLGLEHERGLRIGDVRAPLGKIDDLALNAELIQWRNHKVLAHNIWHQETPQWWEVKTILEALQKHNDLIFIDSSRNVKRLQKCGVAIHAHIVAVEPTVLGMSRAKAHCIAIAQHYTQYEHNKIPSILLVVMRTRHATKRVQYVTTQDVQAYVEYPVAGVIEYDAQLYKRMDMGLSIQKISRKNKKALLSLKRLIVTGNAQLNRAKHSKK
ncbi:MAG: hypothetical protein Q3961_01235 [Bifidobacteriaceae bacterium]|nr:hypothetical protein [Bifidobacteriaceae bacterium]